MTSTRLERDSMGTVEVPEDAFWGAQTQRALENFDMSPLPVPAEFVRALGIIKASAARVNASLGLLDSELAQHMVRAAEEVAEGHLDEHFPVSVFQTGSGTSSNMNANEVIAYRAAQLAARTVHPNDHVNLGQSSNDVVPTAILVSSSVACSSRLLPSLNHLRQSLNARAAELASTVKTGRTHLMDAMPVTFGQELSCWAAQITSTGVRIEDTLRRVRCLPIGGTAVGTGVNAHPQFGAQMCAELSRRTGLEFVSASNLFEGISAQDTAVELSGQLRVLAVALMKMANDLRWMNSGPLAGLGEIKLPELQPGSSIMPGKVNPVIPEALAMACAQVMGNDATIAVAGQSGNFELNVMLPVIAHNLLESINLLARGCRSLADRCIAGFQVNEEAVAAAVERNPILITALNAVIGYEKGAAIAKKAYREGRSVKAVAVEESGLSPDELDALLDPLKLTGASK